MNVIDTREKLKQYILHKLGAPIHDVEISLDQLDMNIDDAIKEFSEVAMEGQETRILVLDIFPDTFEYILDGRIKTIQNLVMSSSSGISSVGVGGGVFLTPTELFAGSVNLVGSVSTTGDRLSQLITSLSSLSLYEKIFGTQVNYRWNEYSKRLSFLEDPYYKGNKCLLECSVSYIPKEVDYIYENPWVRSYATALCKQTWGENVGKYDSTLINGSKIDYTRILQEASAEIEKLKEELGSKWQEPFGVIRG